MWKGEKIVSPVSTSFVLGYHGCDATVAKQIFAGRSALLASENDYDWLGHGIYFWERNAQRAYEFACEVRDSPRHRRHPVKKPSVVGAIIDLGYSLDLLDSRFIDLARQAHDDLALFAREAGEEMPVNSGGPDMLVRRLDCAVIQTVHSIAADRGERPFDSVRAPFVEGSPIYEGAGFHAKSHIQLCVRNPSCIKGYFRPIGDDGRPLAFS